MKHGMRLPVPIHRFGAQAPEEIPLSLKEAFQHGQEKAFPKPAGAAQEIILAVSEEALDIRGFVHIQSPRLS